MQAQQPQPGRLQASWGCCGCCWFSNTLDQQLQQRPARHKQQQLQPLLGLPPSLTVCGGTVPCSNTGGPSSSNQTMGWLLDRHVELQDLLLPGGGGYRTAVSDVLCHAMMHAMYRVCGVVCMDEMLLSPMLGLVKLHFVFSQISGCLASCSG